MGSAGWPIDGEDESVAADLDYVKVVGQLGITAGDGPDPDEYPDTIWCDEGEAWLIPLNTYTKVIGGPSPWTAGHSVIKTSINADGYISWSGQPYVWVVDLTSSKVNPVIGQGKATHRIEFKNVKAQGNPVSFPSVNVRLAADTTDPVTGSCDYTVLSPLPTGGGTPIVVGPPGRNGVGIADVDVEGNALRVVFDDESERDVPLPVAMVDSAAFVGEQIGTPGTPGNVAVGSLIEGSGAVTSLDLSTIRVTTDPNDTPALGELLLVFAPPPRFFADFSGLTPGTGTPDGWSQPWVTSSGWSIVDTGSGSVLRHTASGTGRRLLAWDSLDPPEMGDPTEIVWKWRCTNAASSGGAARAAVRSAGPAAAETGIAAGQQSNGTTGVFRYLSGAASTLSGSGSAKPGLGQADTWYITRMRVDGTQIRVKTWADGSAEPTAWDWEPVDASAPVASGKIGLLPFGSGATDYAWLGVAYRGGVAPTSPVI